MNQIIKSFKVPLTLMLLFCILLMNFIIKTSNLEINTSQILSVTSRINKEKLVKNYIRYRAEKIVDNYYQALSLEEKVGQLFMVSIEGMIIDDRMRSLVQDYKIGGVVFMTGNIGSKTQFAQLTKDMDDLAETKILYAVDQEGGSVARIPWDEAKKISQYQLSLMDRDDFTYEVGVQHAESIKALSIDMNLAPVLDIAFSSDSIMFYRSLGNEPEKVARLGQQLIKAHQSQDILTCAKHFPGIGRTSTDSHNGLPVIDISKDTLINEELLPFIAAINQDIPAIMTGHAMYPQIDPESPSSLYVLFKRVIISL